MKIKIWSSNQDITSNLTIIPFIHAKNDDQLPETAKLMKAGQVVYEATNQNLYQCLGESLSLKEIRQQIIQTFKTYYNLIDRDMSVIWDMDIWQPELAELCASITAIGCVDYEIGIRKTKSPQYAYPETCLIKYASHQLTEELLYNQLAIANAQREVMDLVNGPSNEVTPDYLARYAQKSGLNNKFTVKILDDQTLEKNGFGCIRAVNQGSSAPARLIDCQIKRNNKENYPTVALLGKGVTFDTGGVSIKSSGNMHYMKSDMGGGAIVLACMQALSKLKYPIHVIGLVPATENVVDAKSVKPGDIVRSYGNKTVEIIDTDAEGRLILADTMEYALEKYNPDCIIDLATLTGSTVRTFGSEAAAIFTTNQDSLKLFIQAADHTGERIWPMPLWSEYAEYLQTDIADIRNLGTKPVAGAITAAKFIEFFTNDHPNWIHLDVPASSFDQTPFGKQKAATGYGVHLIVDFLKRYSEFTNM